MESDIRKEPVISVIVPVYNMEADHKLSWCMDSLVGQTIEKKSPGSMQIIAVDDASTDGSLRVLKGYEEKYPGLVKVLGSERNLHQGGAKNLGLEAAKGEWIGFIDADDWVTPDYYERLLDEAERTGADMAGCDYSFVYEHTMTPGERVACNRPEQTGLLTDKKYRLLLLDSGSLVTKIYRRRIILGEDNRQKCDNRHGTGTFPEHIFYEDNAVVCTWMLRATNFAYIPEPLYFYYQHAASTVHTVTEKNLEDRMNAGRLLYEAAVEGGYLEKYRDEIEFLFTELYYKNTLFTAMACYREGSEPAFDVYGFTKVLSDRMREYFPDFQENAYYKERVDVEERGFMALHMRSQLLFFIKYRLLWKYRSIRTRLGTGGAG